MIAVEDLKKEIVRRQKALPKLIQERDQLGRQIAELEALGAVKVAVKRGRKARGRKILRRVQQASRPGSLSSKLVEVLQDKKSLSLSEVIQAVLAAGYKTKSKNFATIVGNTMAKDNRFRRVRKGVYALKG